MTLHNSNDVLAIGGDKFATTKICAANEYINDHVTPHRLHVLNGLHPKHWTTGMLGFPPTEENQHEEEQIYR